MLSLGQQQDATSKWGVSSGQSPLRARAGLAVLCVIVPASSPTSFTRSYSQIGRAHLSAGFAPLSLEVECGVMLLVSMWCGSHGCLCTQRALRPPLGPLGTHEDRVISWLNTTL